ncbi:hypothetical protein LIER_40321 [Lithospermum erythrorhizon]|uniref:DUF4283 domain-containing protein n=1 Tax=Lithospermum erythrorhizon TaxID=34254 RepID=A0AAV3QSX5_LITER
MADGEPPKPPPRLEESVKQSQLSPQILYSDVVKAHSQPYSQQPFELNTIFDAESSALKEISTYQGKPSVVFPFSDKQVLVEKLKYVLVGKFSHGRPPMDTIKKFFVSLKLKGDCNSTIFDKKHIFIECVCKEDYYHIWLKLKWFIDGYAMRVFKWSPDFSPMKESSIAPVWIRVECLPLYLFDEMSLLSISNSIGRPISVDPRNINRTMLHSSRICVELDVDKPLLDAILISFKDEVSKNILEKFWVKVFYDEVPLFCSFCCHIGHGTGTCKRRLEDIRSGQGKAEILSADKVFDNMPQAENSTNSTKFVAGNCGSKMGKQIRPSMEWQPIGKHVPNARSDLDNKVAPE